MTALVAPLDTIPEEIRRDVERRLGTPGLHLLQDALGPVWLVTLSPQPTGGHRLELEDAVLDGDQLVVYVRHIAPSPGAIVTQAFTYPHLLFRLTDRDLPAPIVLVRPEGLRFKVHRDTEGVFA